MDVFEKISSVAKAIKQPGVMEQMGGIADMFNGGKCVYECKDSKKVTYPNPKHKPTFNGCGIPGMKVERVSEGFTECCNKHDICYDTCNSDRLDPFIIYIYIYIYMYNFPEKRDKKSIFL